ncbi:hypothetical protein ACFL6R_00410 [Gemmatimonadota bacterium]
MKRDNTPIVGHLLTGAVLLLLSIPVQARAQATDGYPRQSDIDILRYSFHLTLNDTSDVIVGEARLTVQVLASDVSEFTLDLIGKSGERSRAGFETGMVVTSVSEVGNQGELNFEHTGDTIRVSLLPLPPRKGGNLRCPGPVSRHSGRRTDHLREQIR